MKHPIIAAIVFFFICLLAYIFQKARKEKREEDKKFNEWQNKDK